jgi:hypothetical protein
VQCEIRNRTENRKKLLLGVEFSNLPGGNGEQIEQFVESINEFHPG